MNHIIKNLEDLGYNNEFEQFRIHQKLNNSGVARVIAEHKERYIIQNTEGAFESEITGNMRFSAQSREEFPAVGDWVAFTPYDENSAIIHHVFPRFSVLKRQAVGQTSEVQIIATNIDTAFLVQAVDRDFNLNRLERYLTICNASQINPVIILTKTDLKSEPEVTIMLDLIRQRIPDITVIAISNETQDGYSKIISLIQKGKTYCLLGSSGVGKSSLTNNLAGKGLMKTDRISAHTQKGKHVSTHREMLILQNGGLLIDTPGMRAVGIADTSSGLETTFDQITDLALHCRFKNCTHSKETDCAVLNALDNEDLNQDVYDHYMQLEREKIHFESTVAEKRKKDKAFGKMIKQHKKSRKNNKY